MKIVSFHFSIKIIFTLSIIFIAQRSAAQTLDCSFGEPIIKIDFGTTSDAKDINLTALKRYGKSKNSCPTDGNYAFTNYTSDCFAGKWHSLAQDHTLNDANGRFMLVNASERPSTFFMNYIAGLTASKTYELSFWVVNICKYADGCSPTPPNIKVTLLDGDKEITHFLTGAIAQSEQPFWKKFYAEFTMPQNASTIMIKMDDITEGGCGNDFALDDIVFKECKLNKPQIVQVPKPTETLPKPALKITDNPKNVEAVKPIIKPTISPKVQEVKIIEKPKAEVKTIPNIVKEKTISIPKAIATRENAIARKIETEESEMQIELYDNGEIDGDTVTIYHNNVLIVNHAALSAKPIAMKIKVDKNNPHHELVMVADNLGSIPPNTSLMIITANKRRYEVYISSSEQKNAKVVIDLKQ